MRVVLLLALCLVSCSSRVPEISKPSAGERKEFQLVIPKDQWEPIFFKEINERASIAKLPSLRAALPKDDLETRVWIGFGVTALQGFDLKRSAGGWTGIYIQGIEPKLARSEYEKNLEAPKSGWEGLWKRLVDKGILTLPDASSIGCESPAPDGIGYVVENNNDNTYRTYMYDNPQLAKCKEAKQMLEIVDILVDEFGSQLPRE
jgi:hypothetical protein